MVPYWDILAADDESLESSAFGRESDPEEAAGTKVRSTKADALLSQLFSRIDRTATGHLDEKGIKEFLLLTGCETAHLDYTWSELRRTHGEGSDDRVSKHTAVAFVLADEDLDENGCFKDYVYEAESRKQTASNRRRCTGWDRETGSLAMGRATSDHKMGAGGQQADGASAVTRRTATPRWRADQISTTKSSETVSPKFKLSSRTFVIDDCTTSQAPSS